MILVGSPNVMIGGFPLPSFSAIAQGLLKRIKGIKFEGGGAAWVARRAGSGCPGIQAGNPDAALPLRLTAKKARCVQKPWNSHPLTMTRNVCDD